MLRQLLLSLGVLQGTLAFLASGHGHLDERGPILEDPGRPRSTGLEMAKEVHIPGSASSSPTKEQLYQYMKTMRHMKFQRRNKNNHPKK